MKYKVGDRVLIKSIDWWNNNNDNNINESIRYVKCKDWNFISDMKKYCGKILTIEEVHKDLNRYKMSEDKNLYSWTDEMIECKVEDEIKPKFKVGDILFYRGETSGYLKVEKICVENGEIRYYETSRNVYLVENDPNIFVDKVCSVEIEETKSEDRLLDDYEELTDRAFKGGYEKCKSDIELNGFQLPDGYVFKDEDGNVIVTSKIILEKKKNEYPKTYEECCKIIHSDPKFYVDTHLYSDALGALYKLFICRDAYWKIAGEKMGLGKPWEPDWANANQEKYSLEYFAGEIYGTTFLSHCNKPFTFPTEEIGDTFYDYFEEDLEICKEFL